MYNYRARMYKPGSGQQGGRFMQRDPIGYAGGLNIYSYCGNNPVNFTDPNGLLRIESGGNIEFSELPDYENTMKGGILGLTRMRLTYDSSDENIEIFGRSTTTIPIPIFGPFFEAHYMNLNLYRAKAKLKNSELRIRITTFTPTVGGGNYTDPLTNKSITQDRSDASKTHENVEADIMASIMKRYENDLRNLLTPFETQLANCVGNGASFNSMRDAEEIAKTDLRTQTNRIFGNAVIAFGHSPAYQACKNAIASWHAIGNRPLTNAGMKRAASNFYANNPGIQGAFNKLPKQQ